MRKPQDDRPQHGADRGGQASAWRVSTHSTTPRVPACVEAAPGRLINGMFVFDRRGVAAVPGPVAPAPARAVWKAAPPADALTAGVSGRPARPAWQMAPPAEQRAAPGPASGEGPAKVPRWGVPAAAAPMRMRGGAAELRGDIIDDWQSLSSLPFRRRSPALQDLDRALERWKSSGRVNPDMFDLNERELQDITDAIERWWETKDGDSGRSTAMNRLQEEIRERLADVGEKQRQISAVKAAPTVVQDASLSGEDAVANSSSQARQAAPAASGSEAHVAAGEFEPELADWVQWSSALALDDVSSPGTQPRFGAGSAADLRGAGEEAVSDVVRRAVEELRRSMVAGRADAFGGDPFGIRVSPGSPRFLRVDGRGSSGVSTLHADQRAAFFDLLDMRRSGEPSAAELLPGSLARQPETVSAGTAAGSQNREAIPHLVHSIWFGGPLHDDGANGSRTEFRLNITVAAQRNPAFRFMLWTDVSRREIEEVRELTGGDEMTARQRQVKSMLDWAATAPNIRLINIDEVFNREGPMLLESEVRTERARGGKSYAVASDMARVEILHRFGGVYTDGDNKVNTLAGTVEQTARRSDGFALIRDNVPQNPDDPAGWDGRTMNNSAIVATADSKATDAFLRFLRDNYRLTYAELLRTRHENLQGVADDVLSRRAPEPQVEVVLRTGPNKRLFEYLAEALGHTSRIGENRFFLGVIPPESIQVEARGSWHVGFSENSVTVDLSRLRDMIRAAVINLHAELRNRPGVVYLPSMERAMRALPAAHRVPVWNAALMLFRESLGDAASQVRWVSGVGVEIPAEVRHALGNLFPDATLEENAPDQVIVAPAPEPLSVWFAEEQHTLEPDQRWRVTEVARQAAAFAASLGHDRRLVIQVTGLGNGSFGPSRNESAAATGRRRADHVVSTLREAMAWELAKRRAPRGRSPVLIDDVKFLPASAGRGSGQRERTRRRADIEFFTEPARMTSQSDLVEDEASPSGFDVEARIHRRTRPASDQPTSQPHQENEEDTSRIDFLTNDFSANEVGPAVPVSEAHSPATTAQPGAPAGKAGEDDAGAAAWLAGLDEAVPRGGVRQRAYEALTAEDPNGARPRFGSRRAEVHDVRVEPNAISGQVPEMSGEVGVWGQTNAPAEHDTGRSDSGDQHPAAPDPAPAKEKWRESSYSDGAACVSVTVIP